MHRVMSCDMSMGLCQMYVCWKCLYVTQNVCMLEMYVCWKCTYVGSVCMLEVYVCWKCLYVGSVRMLQKMYLRRICMLQRINYKILSHCCTKYTYVSENQAHDPIALLEMSYTEIYRIVR